MQAFHEPEIYDGTVTSKRPRRADSQLKLVDPETSPRLQWRADRPGARRRPTADDHLFEHAAVARCVGMSSDPDHGH
jgi:hypothetical protein